MLRHLVPIVLIVAASLVVAGPTRAGKLLRVEGQIVKWAPPETGKATVITYAVLTDPYSLPSDRHTLSPDNCGVMRAFAEIVSASTASTAVSEANARQQLLSAFAAWEMAAGVRFIEVSELQAANIIIGAADVGTGQAYANLTLAGRQDPQPFAKALGAAGDARQVDLPRSAKDRPVALIERAYVCLNPKMRWKIGFDGNLDVYDLRYTFIHEIGHAIGLDHPGSSGSIMGYRYDERVRQLQASDISAAQLLYGQPKDE